LICEICGTPVKLSKEDKIILKKVPDDCPTLLLYVYPKCRNCGTVYEAEMESTQVNPVGE
jgi:uncharacterized Zn finger protein